MNKILITGAAGFIGYHLIEKLIKENTWDIVGLDNINDYYDVNLKYARISELGILRNKIKENELVLSNKTKNYHFIKLDLLDKENLFNLFKNQKFDYVINLAAQAGVRYSLINPSAYIDSNIYGFLNLIEGCKNNSIKHFLFSSSSSVYGANKKVPFSESDNVDHPISLYAATKKSNELIAFTYSHLFGLPTTGLRLFTVYGPWGRPDMAYYKFADSILNNKPIKIFNNGNMERDFTYIDDITEAISKLILKTPNPISSNETVDTNALYSIYNLGGNKLNSLKTFIAALENCMNKVAIKEYEPMQPGDLPVTYADINNIKEAIGFEPKITLTEGLTRFVNWYLNYVPNN